MKVKRLQMGITACVMAAAMVFSMPLGAFAEEVESLETEAEGVSAEGAVDENGNPVDENGNPIDATPTEPTSQGGVVMSGLPSNNGKVIASQFPEEYIPEGFHKSTCTYEGQTIEIAYMDNGNGEVVLAYLANADGSDGDFYLCDINTAEMSDFVQIYGGEGKYIIVLDPRDMVVAPAGFTKANLQWYGKSVAAWLLPGNGTEKEEKEEAKGSVPALFEACAGAGRTMTVYAAGADGEEGEALPEDSAEDAQTEKAASEAEDGSGVVAADPSQYFMVYAINQDGVIGFYLYDTSEGTYQRYVQVDTGEGTTVDKYRSSAQNRLIVIAVLAVALVICLFVMINLILKQRDRDDDYEDEEEDDEEDDEMEQMRRRVAKKEKSHIRTGRRELNYLLDMEEDEDDEEDEDEMEEDEMEDEPDWEHMQIRMPETRQSTNRRREEPTPVRTMEQRQSTRQPMPMSSSVRPVSSARPASSKAAASRPSSANSAATKSTSGKPSSTKKASRPKPDLDEDFEFEFLDI